MPLALDVTGRVVGEALDSESEAAVELSGMGEA